MQRDALRAALTSLLCRNKKPIYQKNVDGSEGIQPATSKPSLQIIVLAQNLAPGAYSP